MGWSLSPRRPDRSRFRPSLEGLEARRVLSGYVGATPADEIIGASATRSLYGIDGAGETAAVIDTGVNYRHEALGDGFGPGAKVRGGYDFADHDPNPNATTWEHGTAVAGLIASDDPAHQGVAPGADIVALRVFGDNNQGSFDDVANALQWVIDNHARYGITVANLSLSDGNNYANNWFAHDGGIGERISGLVQELADLDIPVVSAAGNSFNGQQGMGFTAILDQTISVTATDATDHLAADAQRLGATLNPGSATDLAAPGTGLIAPIEGNQFSSVDGTSFSAAQVSGAVILLQQIYESRFGHLPAVSDLVGWLKAGSDPIADPVTGITVGRLDIPKAAALVPSAPPPATSSSLTTVREPLIHHDPVPAPNPVPVPLSVPPLATVAPTVPNRFLGSTRTSNPAAPEPTVVIPSVGPTWGRPRLEGHKNPWRGGLVRVVSRTAREKREAQPSHEGSLGRRRSGPSEVVVAAPHPRHTTRFRGDRRAGPRS